MLAARQVETQENQIQQEITDLILFLILQLQQVAVVLAHIGLVILHIKQENLEDLVAAAVLELHQQLAQVGQEHQVKVTLVGKPTEEVRIMAVAAVEKMLLVLMGQVQQVVMAVRA